MTQVITLDGEIINVGPWDAQEEYVEVVTNPYNLGGDPPENWDFGIVVELREINPLPQGAIEEDLEIMYDHEGRVRRASDSAKYALIAQIGAAKSELDSLMVDIQLGMASPGDIDRAKELRVFLKDNPAS